MGNLLAEHTALALLAQSLVNFHGEWSQALCNQASDPSPGTTWLELFIWGYDGNINAGTWLVCYLMESDGWDLILSLVGLREKGHPGAILQSADWLLVAVTMVSLIVFLSHQNTSNVNLAESLRINWGHGKNSPLFHIVECSVLMTDLFYSGPSWQDIIASSSGDQNALPAQLWVWSRIEWNIYTSRLGIASGIWKASQIGIIPNL